jgi:hypothetical protein
MMATNRELTASLKAVGHRGSRADSFACAGGFKSRTMIVIITEKTPPENAVSLSVGVPQINMTALIRFD